MATVKKTEAELIKIILTSVKGLKRLHEKDKGLDGRLHSWIDDTSFEDIANAIKKIKIKGVKSSQSQFCISERLYISFAAW